MNQDTLYRILNWSALLIAPYSIYSLTNGWLTYLFEEVKRRVTEFIMETIIVVITLLLLLAMLWIFSFRWKAPTNVKPDNNSTNDGSFWRTIFGGCSGKKGSPSIQLQMTVNNANGIKHNLEQSLQQQRLSLEHYVVEEQDKRAHGDKEGQYRFAQWKEDEQKRYE